MHRATFKALVKHPSKWTKAEVTDWFHSACNGAFQREGAHPVCLLCQKQC